MCTACLPWTEDVYTMRDVLRCIVSFHITWGNADGGVSVDTRGELVWELTRLCYVMFELQGNLKLVATFKNFLIVLLFLIKFHFLYLKRMKYGELFT